MHLPFDVLPSLPPLFRAYVRDPASLGEFFPEPPTLDNIERFARESVILRSNARQRLAEVLGAQQRRWGGSPEAAAKLGNGAVAVVTGQQAGLFTGPLLAVFKALTAVKLARELERRGVRAVPVFWIAADDHDHDEIAWTGIVNQDSEYERISTVFDGADASPVAWIRYSDTISATIAACFESLPASEWREEVRGIVEAAYRPASSPVDAFATMMIRLFRDMPLVMADPMDAALRPMAEDVLATAFGEKDEIRGAVLGRTREIEAAGYAGQVRVDQTFTGLFLLRNGLRLPLDPAVSNGVTPAELSPNVLLRPVVQDTLFPTAAYVAGPAEVAYLAQAGAVYERMGRAMPPICPRITATLVEPPVARVMKKYDLDLGDVFAGAEHIRQRVTGALGDGRVFDEVEQGIRDQVERLRPLLEGTDRTLGGALDNSIEKLTRQVGSLRSRFGAARTRQDELLGRQLASLTHRLFPEKTLQERAVNVTSFLVRYGTHLISLMDERLDLDGSTHQVLEF